MEYSDLKNETHGNITSLKVESLALDLPADTVAWITDDGVVTSSALNLGEFLAGGTHEPVPTHIAVENGLKKETSKGVIKISIDPESDITFHDITATGNITGANLSGTNTGDVTIEEIGDSPNDAGASIDGQVITLQPASADHGGVLTAGSQVIGGNKTFKGEVFMDDLATVDALNLAHGELQIVGYFTSIPRTVTIPNVGASSSFVLTAGDQSIGGTKQFNGVVFLKGNTLLMGTAGELKLQASSGSARTYNIPDAGSTADFVMTSGNQAIAGAKTFSSSLTVENNISGRYIYVGSSTQNSLLRLVGYFTDTPVTFTLPDVGGNANFVMTAGAQTIGGAKTFSGNISAANLSGTNSGDVTVSALGTGNANGLSVSGQALQLHPATSTQPGVLSTGAQTIAGAKTFSGNISAANLSGSNSGDVSIGTVGGGTTYGMSLSGQGLSLHVASASYPGIVSIGTQTFAGRKTFSGGLQSDSTFTLQSTPIQGSGAGYGVDIPNAGKGSWFVLTEGAQTINGAKTFSDLVYSKGSQSVGSITGTTSMATSAWGTKVIVSGSSGYNITLPTHASGASVEIIFNTTSNALITLLPASGSINGQSSMVFGVNESVKLISTGSNYIVENVSLAPVSASVYLSGALSLTAGSYTKFAFDGVSWNTHGWDTTNKRFQPKYPGKYTVNGMCGTYNSGGGTTVHVVAIYKNGVALAYPAQVNGGSVITTRVPYTFTCNMNGSTDYLEVYMYQYNSTTGANLPAESGTTNSFAHFSRVTNY